MTAAQRRAAEKSDYDAFLARCPSRQLLDRISDKWVTLVLAALSDGPQRYSELARRIAGVSQKMLTQTLRSLERDGLVTRTVTATVPVTVSYELTELGRSLPDMWSGTFQRGVQLHDLRDAVTVWAKRYGQRGWLRQLEQPVTREMEDRALKTVARLDGTPFPSSAQLAMRWARGRVPRIRLPWQENAAEEPDLETAYCAEVVAVTYEDMGLLPRGKPASWYDPGRFWSGDDLELTPGYRLGDEISVEVPPT
jgi:DNA-binding HxlR family transcriptional regulator